ncbi:MAG TPA: DsbA family oxidoreductase [Terriglobia bacterium]|nr:DsbA family oxidoreductase [Terriglobia bacterium]
MTPMKLEVFTDLVCPWCYLSTPRVDRLERHFEIDVEWVFFPLHPETPPEGLALKDLFAGRTVDLEAAHARLKAMMESEGLQFNERRYTYNSRLAQELAKAFPQLRGRLYRAYFEEAKNIANPDILVAIAESEGVSAEAARRVLTERLSREAVDDDWRRARRYGVTGVPSFVAGGQMLVGAHPYETLERFVRAAGARSRSTLS